MTDAVTRKRLGQYFSGRKVATMLVDLCAPDESDTVIDPMAGIGDMIVATIQSGVPAENTSGVEIDPEAGIECRDRISPGRVYIGDAFSPEPYAVLGHTSWDLVITNPPYVRYQSMNDFEGEGISLKNAKETRHGLRTIVSGLDHLPDDEKRCFLTIIDNYSGLSDLAVPSWLLCAALTKVGGRIAMVLPESWISRDYALSIRYMLLRLFDIEFIVEDLNSVWFPDALVKTNLLVARRVRLRRGMVDIEDLKYTHIRLGAGLIGETGLVEDLNVGGYRGREAFRFLLHSCDDVSGDGFEVRHLRLSGFMSEMVNSQAYKRLLRKMEQSTTHSASAVIPKELRDAIEHDIPSTDLSDLEGWGFHIGQGMRTGANRFFYMELLKSEGPIDHLIANKIFGYRSVPVSQRYSLPAFRYQRDSHGRMAITKALLPHRLLYIQEDFYDANGNLQNAADESLAKHISSAARMSIKNNGQITHFPELSAVKTNVRCHDSSGNALKRYWFMLPALANRHEPQLCIPRVNYKDVRCFFLADDGIVVDANFSTIWTTDGDKRRVYAMFALLNSAWTHGYLETISTVMGGGALKVEATHIRKLLLPTPTDELISSLSLLGESLAECNPSENKRILSEINYTVMRSLIRKSEVGGHMERLYSYLHSKIDARQH